MQINLHKDLGLNWINLTEFQEVSYLNLFLFLSQYIIAKTLGSNNSFNACPGEPGFILLIQIKRLLMPLKNNVFENIMKNRAFAQMCSIYLYFNFLDFFIVV